MHSSLVHAVPLSAGTQEIRGRPSEPRSVLWNSTANCSVHSCQYLLFWYLLHTYFQAFLQQCKVYKIPQGKKKLVEFPVEPHYFGTLDFTQLQWLQDQPIDPLQVGQYGVVASLGSGIEEWLTSCLWLSVSLQRLSGHVLTSPSQAMKPQNVTSPSEHMWQETGML